MVLFTTGASALLYWTCDFPFLAVTNAATVTSPTPTRQPRPAPGSRGASGPSPPSPPPTSRCSRTPRGDRPPGALRPGVQEAVEEGAPQGAERPRPAHVRGRRAAADDRQGRRAAQGDDPDGGQLRLGQRRRRHPAAVGP